MALQGMSMHLVQILLPLADNAGRRFDGAAYGRIRTELSERFGGITSFLITGGGSAPPNNPKATACDGLQGAAFRTAISVAHAIRNSAKAR